MKKEFQKFKNIVTQQMSTIGGGGEVNLRKLDDVDDSSKANGFALKYNSSTDKFEFGEVAFTEDTRKYMDGKRSAEYGDKKQELEVEWEKFVSNGFYRVGKDFMRMV